MYRIPVYSPTIGDLEKAKVLECLESGWISSRGPYVAAFESAFANSIGRAFGSSTTNGTAALHLALLALGIGPGDEVIVPALTYVATANCVTYTGAKVVFCDVDPGTMQIDVASAAAAVTGATRAIIAVHLYGNAAPVDHLRRLCDERGLYLIEDCAEAIGTRLNGRPVGSFGQVAAFSFFGNKTITTGEGGMVCTDDPALAARVALFKNQGLSASGDYFHEVVGFNYRMTSLAAAIGLAQIERLPQILARKRAIAARYRAGLGELPGLRFERTPSNVHHSHWLVTVFAPTREARDKARAALAAAGVETRPVFWPLHLLPMYEGAAGDFPAAEDLAVRGFNLPSHPDLADDELDYVIDQLRACTQAQAA